MPSAARRLQDEREPAPFLKWAGGKRQLLDKILERLPRGRIRRYAEPFVGGGAVFFELARQDRVEKALLADTNADLIETYRAVREEPEDVIEALSIHKNDAEHYYAVRAMAPEGLSKPERAARTIFLNRCGYNGLYRVNLSGKFNVPFGRYENPSICDAEGLRAASKALQRAELRLADFATLAADLREGDVAYFDPPYVPVSATSFTAYTQNGFSLGDQTRLRDEALRLKREGVSVLVSNSNSAIVRTLYRDGFRAAKVSATRMVNCNAARRGRVTELLLY